LVQVEVVYGTPAMLDFKRGSKVTPIVVENMFYLAFPFP
jgi:hypothetical protein